MISTRSQTSLMGKNNLTESEFKRIAEIAKSRWGLNLDQAKSPLIFSRLKKRISEINLVCFSEYCKVIESGDIVEADFFVAALTTNVTSFYRELHHFNFLEKEVIPNLVKEAESRKRIRFWSAGCSSGQEAFSLAGSLFENSPEVSNMDVKILATDIDKEILKKAKLGRYQHYECKFPNEDLVSRIFETELGECDESKLVREKLLSLITFRHLNLIDAWPFSGKFDVIMCRNVAIYFDRKTQQQLWSRFSNLLTPKGHLFVGHSERIVDPQSFGLRAVGTTTYKKMEVVDVSEDKERTRHGTEG